MTLMAIIFTGTAVDWGATKYERFAARNSGKIMSIASLIDISITLLLCLKIL